MSDRKSIGSVIVSGVSPKTDFDKPLTELKTVGLKLNYEQAVELKRLLDDAIREHSEWNYLNLTGFRETKQVTVTYYKPVK